MNTLVKEAGGYKKLSEITGISVNTLKNYSRIGYKVEHITAKLLHKIAVSTSRTMDEVYELLLKDRKGELTSIQ